MNGNGRIPMVQYQFEYTIEKIANLALKKLLNIYHKYESIRKFSQKYRNWAEANL